MDHHPLGRIERDGIGKLDAVQPDAEFRAKKSRPGVGRINVQPDILGAA